MQCNLNQVIHGPHTELIAWTAECSIKLLTAWQLPHHVCGVVHPVTPHETILWHASRNGAANLCNKLVTVNWLRQGTLRPTKEPKQTPAHPESIQANRIKAHLLCQLHARTHCHTHTHTPTHPHAVYVATKTRQKAKRQAKLWRDEQTVESAYSLERFDRGIRIYYRMI